MRYDAEKQMTNHAPKDSTIVDRYEALRAPFKEVAKTVDELCPDSREKSLAFTNLEQALMWAVKSIAVNQDSLVE